MQKGWTGEEKAQRVYKGELKGLEDGAVHLEEAKMGPVALPREKIHTAKLVLTDKLIAATKPIDTTGVDDIVEDTSEEKADD